MARIPCPYDYPNNCSCNTCVSDRRAEKRGRNRDGGSRRRGGRRSSWSEPMGGGDSAGNEVTVQFGEGNAEGETRLGDGDRSEGDFFRSENHDHYGSGDGSHDNGTSRGQYTGPGH